MARSPAGARRAAGEALRRGGSVRFLSEVVSELRRVTWPTRQETFRLTMMVLAVSAVLGVILGALDLGFTQLFTVILGR